MITRKFETHTNGNGNENQQMKDKLCVRVCLSCCFFFFDDTNNEEKTYWMAKNFFSLFIHCVGLILLEYFSFYCFYFECSFKYAMYWCEISTTWYPIWKVRGQKILMCFLILFAITNWNGELIIHCKICSNNSVKILSKWNAYQLSKKFNWTSSVSSCHC